MRPSLAGTHEEGHTVRGQFASRSPLQVQHLMMASQCLPWSLLGRELAGQAAAIQVLPWEVSDERESMKVIHSLHI